MATIEERAKKYILHCSTAPANRLGRLQGYIKGATEQRQIDIDKACKWLKNELFDNNEDFFYPVLESKHYRSVEELVVAFRKAMTKEE